MKEIAEIVAEYYGIPKIMLKSKLRDRKYVLPRQVAMYILRLRPNATLYKVAEHFEKDHSSVCHAVKTVKSLMQVYPKLKADVEFLIDYTSEVEVKECPLCRPVTFPKKATIV